MRGEYLVWEGKENFGGFRDFRGFRGIDLADKIYFCFAKIKLSRHTLYKLNWLQDQYKIIDFMQHNIKMQYALG